MAVRITYFTHGTTTDNEKDLATGWSQGELSETGTKQAIELRELIRRRKFDAVFCSDLKRAVDSAAIAFGQDYKIIEDKRLRECDYGAYSGQPVESFRPTMTDFIENPFPNGESYIDVERRVGEFLKFLKKDYDGRHVAIVAHRATQLALEVLACGRTWKHAIGEDWRNKKAWKPGWDYFLR